MRLVVGCTLAFGFMTAGEPSQSVDGWLSLHAIKRRLFTGPSRQLRTYSDIQVLCPPVNRVVVAQEKMVGVIMCRAAELIQPIPLHGGFAGRMIRYL